jgi:prophage regulatory protein
MNTMEIIIREPECQIMTGLSKTTRWRMIRLGKFPASRKISNRCVGWIRTEVQDWLRSRPKVGSLGSG